MSERMSRDELIAYLDSLSPEEHHRRIQEARDRIEMRRTRAREAAERLRREADE